MKILLVHNDYGKYSGEEAVVDKIAVMFRKQGHTVCFYRKTTADDRESVIGNIKGFFSGIYSPLGVKGMREILRKEKPDMVNVHNLYPFISPAALFECKKAGVPVVMTVHNFRLICPTGLFMRNGMPCETCLEKKNEWSCLRYNCEHSLLKSAGYTLRSIYARWTKAYKKNADYFVCITEFQKQKLIVAGFDEKKIVVIPNSINIPENPDFIAGKYVAYCGRISEEKGIDLILNVAVKHPEIPFRFAGEINKNLQGISNIPNNCKFMGHLSGGGLYNFYLNASFFVMASKCYEGFPMTILEAACYGKPVIAPNHGGFPEIIGAGDNAVGRLFIPNDPDDLEKTVVKLWNNPLETKKLGEKAFEKLRKEYTTEVIYKKWEELMIHLNFSKR
jgi:glycosyltransferase involved in cell wall biosynthesis